jgi:hypothetical protein
MLLFAVSEAVHVFLQVGLRQKYASAMWALVEMVVVFLFCHVPSPFRAAYLVYVEVYFFVV